jgi:gamma-glutamylcyclotransferase (GGCT)/AIG2-like uncharacterized protein YtfP
MGDYLFTYGTLRPGHAPGEIASVVEKLRPVGAGFVHGTLYDLGEYTGAVLDSNSARRIPGLISQLPEDARVLQQLDEYEGFDPRAPDKSLFIRTLQSVVVAPDRTLQCWIYVYNPELDPTRVLPGDGSS